MVGEVECAIEALAPPDTCILLLMLHLLLYRGTLDTWYTHIIHLRIILDFKYFYLKVEF